MVKVNKVKNRIFYQLCGIFILLITLFTVSTAFLYSSFSRQAEYNPNDIKKEYVYLSPVTENPVQVNSKISSRFLLIFMLFVYKFIFPERSAEKQNVFFYCKITAYWLFKKELLFSPREQLP